MNDDELSDMSDEPMDELYAEEMEENKLILEKLSIMSQVDLYN